MQVLYDAPLRKESIDEITRLVPGIKLIETPSRPPRDLLAEADVVYTQSADFNTADAPRLRWVQTNSASTESVWGKPVMESPVPVCNVSGAYSVTVAECVFAMLLALTRKIDKGVHAQQKHDWPSDERYIDWCGVDLYGMTMGIVGYGSIGRQVGRLAQSFGMNVLACKRRPQDHKDDSFLLPGSGDPDGLIPSAWYGIDGISEMFARSDVVVVTLPGIPTTRQLIGAKHLAALPRHAWVINIGRGVVFDEPALYQILREKKIAGAGLDVFVEEPLPPASPFWDLPNLLIMPHVGSWSNKQARYANQVLIENLRRDRAGEPLVNVIDKQLRY